MGSLYNYMKDNDKYSMIPSMNHLSLGSIYIYKHVYIQSYGGQWLIVTNINNMVFILFNHHELVVSWVMGVPLTKSSNCRFFDENKIGGLPFLETPNLGYEMIWGTLQTIIAIENCHRNRWITY